MKYAGIINNDVVNSCYDVAVSYWAQGCPFKCEGCHNPQAWNFDGGIEIDEDDLITQIISVINKNDIQRNLSILGGEPLCKENVEFTIKLLRAVKKAYPSIKCFVWTGFKYEDICSLEYIIFPYIDVLIDGQFDINQKDITLPFRGSTNQRVIDVQKSLKDNKIVLYNGE